MSHPGTVYRFFDSAGALLYVGISVRPTNRIAEHSRTQPWWFEAAKIKLTHYPDIDLARAEERRAIVAEHPRYNVAGTVVPPTPWELDQKTYRLLAQAFDREVVLEGAEELIERVVG